MTDEERKYARSRPAETDDDWRDIWLATERSHLGWKVVRVAVAVAENWKIIALMIGGAIALGGRDILLAMGVPLP